ncbi:mfs general substrate transporter [Diplodia corticola]|uniref:Mfs general substrate transporter n=1 Tax=Diplodia corticola TaxID=236234 RepID=A0A1J9QL82_9PEZI|nr:mfs general substrate transporter [Diplodia corticola]OJD29224.1 mfs general substrate transporter [Diplodia corticola]
MAIAGIMEEPKDALNDGKALANPTEKDIEGSVPESTPAPSELEPVVTLKTWIVVCFLSFGYGLCFWPVPTAAAVGTLVSADFGQPNAYVWFVPAWTISVTISFMIGGANTDLLGRRWFLVGGNLLCVVGHLIAGASKQTGNPNMITAGMALAGFGGGFCQMAAFALPELLPNKWRHIGIIIADGTVYITILIAPITARYSYEFANWEWNFYAPAIFQFASFLGLFFLYFPPAHPSGLPLLQALRKIDYIGILLFTTSTVPILTGIVWAGIHPATSPHVLASLTSGFALLLLFGLWETYGQTPHPLAPTRIFAAGRGRDFTAPALALSITNMFYYSSSILWPTMTTVFYTSGGADWVRATVLTLPQGMAICGGAAGLAAFGARIHGVGIGWRWQLVAATVVVVVFGALLGLATPTNMGVMCAFLVVSQTAFAWAVPLSIMLSQLGVRHEDLGISGGVSGSLRFAGSAVATTVYQTIFNNEVAKWTPKLVVPAALDAGLDQARSAELLAVVGTSQLATASFSPAVVAAASEALKWAYCKGIFVVSMSSMGFGIVAIIACLMCKDVESKMTNTIDVYLENDEFAHRNKVH